MKKSLLTLLASTVVAVGCASQPAAKPVTSSEVTAAINAAQASAAQAAKVQNEWRDTGKLIKKAEAAEKAGDYAKALKLADKANQQGQEAAAQHARELHYVEHHRVM